MDQMKPMPAQILADRGTLTGRLIPGSIESGLSSSSSFTFDSGMGMLPLLTASTLAVVNASAVYSFCLEWIMRWSSSSFRSAKCAAAGSFCLIIDYSFPSA